jgi:acetoacetate decarboxylase
MKRIAAKMEENTRPAGIPRGKPLFACLIFLLLAVIFPAPSAHAAEAGVFRMPPAAPVSGEAPLKYADSRQVMVFFKSTPEAVRKLVPRPLEPDPGAVMAVMAAHWNAMGFRTPEYNDGGGKILEAALLVPVRFGNERGVYTVILYLDNASRIPMSREIWGFPKKLADVAVDEKEGGYTTAVKIGDATVLKLRFERTEKVDPLPPSRPGTVFSLKVIPSAGRNGPPEVLQIIRTKTNFRAREAWRGKAVLELGGSQAELPAEIPVLEILSANEARIDGSMDYGEVVHDYLDGDGK